MTARAKVDPDGSTKIDLKGVWLAWLPMVIAIGGIIYNAAIANVSRPQRDEVKMIVKEAIEQKQETVDARFGGMKDQLTEMQRTLNELRQDIKELRKEKRP